MKYLIIFLLLTAAGCSCKINQLKNNKRVGLWIQSDTVGGLVYSSRGRFKNGVERKTWRYHIDGNMYKKERYRDSICHTTFYHPNGEKKLEGNTILAADGKLLHWYYNGQWKEFDTLGNVVGTRIYDKGELRK